MPEVLRHYLPDRAQRAAAQRQLDQAIRRTTERITAAVGGDARQIRRAIRAQVVRNLAEKRTAGFPMSARDIERTVFDYEAFKARVYVTSGVFPKRYFGYLDGKWDTAAAEHTLRTTAHRAVALANAELKRRHARVRVNDAEVIVTFLAEGGARLLLDGPSRLNDIHPVYGIGLDDIATGFQRFPSLVATYDHAFRTALAKVVEWRDGRPYLAKHFTFKEAILGTAVMWTYEKSLTEEKLARAGRKPLEARPVDEQYILASLVYNSGILFSEERVDQIRRFRTGAYLDRLTRKVASRPRLPVLPPKEALEKLSQGYPDQPTSWSAVYHVLQRYGAWKALMTLTDDFTPNGMLRPIARSTRPRAKPAVGRNAPQ